MDIGAAASLPSLYLSISLRQAIVLQGGLTFPSYFRSARSCVAVKIFHRASKRFALWPTFPGLSIRRQLHSGLPFLIAINLSSTGSKLPATRNRKLTNGPRPSNNKTLYSRKIMKKNLYLSQTRYKSSESVCTGFLLVFLSFLV